MTAEMRAAGVCAVRTIADGKGLSHLLSHWDLAATAVWTPLPVVGGSAHPDQSVRHKIGLVQLLRLFPFQFRTRCKFNYSPTFGRLLAIILVSVKIASFECTTLLHRDY